MYNLLMSADEAAWNSPTWTIEKTRFLEYTEDRIREKIDLEKDEVRSFLMSIPTIFAYEMYVDAPVRVGRIVDIKAIGRDISVWLSIDHSVPQIQPQIFWSLASSIGISHKFERHRTHWAVKDIDIAKILKDFGLITVPDLIPQSRPPKVFISYSWDSPDHNAWVAGLGASLRSNGVDATLDQWYVRGGTDLSSFMEKNLREADRVLVICTAGYHRKAMAQTGGVGYEHSIISGAMMRDLGTEKFIPIIVRGSSDEEVVPSQLSTRMYYDFSTQQLLNVNFPKLLRDLHNIQTPVPPLGRSPFQLF